MNKKEYQIDIYGNLKLVKIVRLEKKMDRNYQNKLLKEKRKKKNV